MHVLRIFQSFLILTAPARGRWVGVTCLEGMKCFCGLSQVIASWREPEVCSPLLPEMHVLQPWTYTDTERWGQQTGAERGFLQIPDLLPRMWFSAKNSSWSNAYLKRRSSCLWVTCGLITKLENWTIALRKRVQEPTWNPPIRGSSFLILVQIHKTHGNRKYVFIPLCHYWALLSWVN